MNPQLAGAGVSAGLVAGTVVGTGAGVTFPPEERVQPAVKSTDTSTTMHIPYIRRWVFINDHVSSDIRRKFYLWVYLTAKIGESTGHCRIILLSSNLLIHVNETGTFFTGLSWQVCFGGEQCVL